MTVDSSAASRRRDARLRERARQTIRYELEGAAKDGLVPDDDWEELVHGRDVLALLREVETLRAQASAVSRESDPTQEAALPPKDSYAPEYDSPSGGGLAG